ncbi:MAG: hypothetical protein ACFFDF_06885 [Candidatus Odinarchaeota archaeon]
MANTINAQHTDIIKVLRDDDAINKFKDLIDIIQNYLGLDPITYADEVSITCIKEIHEKDNHFNNMGVNRYVDNNFIHIEILESFRKFIPIILLREAYMCFIPSQLRDNQTILISLHEILITDLSKLTMMKEWKELVRERLVDYGYLQAQNDQMHRFFEEEALEGIQSPIQFFFEFIRDYIPIFQAQIEHFYDLIWEEYLYKITPPFYDDEILETFRILTTIFYSKKVFTNFGEYEELFRQFKDNGTILTSLSQRKFSKNFRWISNHMKIGPAYDLTYFPINLVIVRSILYFNPILNRKDIKKFLGKLPFIHRPDFSKNGFADSLHCFFLIPAPYLKDLLGLLERLHNSGYVLQHECGIWTDYSNLANLNYFRKNFTDRRRILNLNHRDYDDRLEVTYHQSFDEPENSVALTLLDWAVIESAHSAGPAGLKFEEKSGKLKEIKNKVLDQIESERKLINEIIDSVNTFHDSKSLQEELLIFLDRIKPFGFFYAEDILQQMIVCLNMVEKILRHNPYITNLHHFQEFLKTGSLFHTLDENLQFQGNKRVWSTIYNDFLPLYFSKLPKYNKLKKKYQSILQVFSACRKLKVFSIANLELLITDQEMTKTVYSAKENKLKASYEIYKKYRITDEKINLILTLLLNANVLSPILHTSLITSTFAKYHPILILRDTPEVNKTLDTIKKYIPRLIITKYRSLITNKSFIHIFFYFLNIQEKEQFASLIHTIFKRNVVSFKRCFTSGLSPFYNYKNFYDFDNDEFFYTKDLFEQSNLYIEKVLGDPLKPLKESRTNSQGKFWMEEEVMDQLIEEVGKRVSNEQLDFSISHLEELINFNEHLPQILLEPEKFKMLKESQFFTTYIKSIKFIPDFHAFGLDQFYLYIHPSQVDKIDFKHLFLNTFQSITYPSIVDNTNSFLIKYIFPFRTPNMKHLSRYTKTEKLVREYCLFSVRRIYHICNIDNSLNPTGWNYEFKRFQIHIQNVLFTPDYNPQIITRLRTFDQRHFPRDDCLGPSSKSFQVLTELYSWKSLDVKSFLGSRQHFKISKFTHLLQENLIFPFVSLKNLDFQDKLHIILPNIEKTLNQTLVQIFSYFNYGVIYEIEGEFFIHGFNNSKEIKFENGLMIKIYFPQCELHEFINLIEKVFEYLHIDKYIMLSDLVSGKTLLKNIYGSLDFFESYSPLKNLIWNEKDKIWINHKVHDEHFTHLYPPLESM